MFFDAEHFFDGYKANPDYALSVVRGGGRRPAPTAWCCATPTAGSLPHEVQRIVAEVGAACRASAIGIHTQNDSGCAVANSVAAVVAGATQVQGTVNGYGERTGNANLMTVIPDSRSSWAIATLPEGRLERLTDGRCLVAETGQPAAAPADPYVGVSRVRPQGRPAHLGARAGGRRHLRARRPDGRWATTPGCWCRISAAAPACR